MVATLSKLHDYVEQASLAFLSSNHAIDGVDVFLQQGPVPLALHLGHANVDVDLLLGKQTLLDIRLDSSKEERSQDLVQLLDNGVLFCVVILGGRLRLSIRSVGFVDGLSPRLASKPCVEVGHVREDVWQQEVEKRPEFV